MVNLKYKLGTWKEFSFFRTNLDNAKNICNANNFCYKIISYKRQMENRNSHKNVKHTELQPNLTIKLN